MDAITATSGATAGAAVQANGLEGITGQDFLNVLVKQLQYQDPFEPMSNEEMVAQISTIRELEMNSKLVNNLDRLTTEQRFGAAAAMIGRMVSGAVADENGNEFGLTGIVTGIRFTESGATMLELDNGEVLPLSNVHQVTDPQPSPEDDTQLVDSGDADDGKDGDEAAAKSLSDPVVEPDHILV